MRFEITTEKFIKAPAHEIMSILLDTENYPQWNPFIIKVEGHFKENVTVKITILPPQSKEMSFKPKILKVSPDEIRWKGKVLIPGLFDGEHYFKLISISEHETKLIHGEVFTGLLVRLLSGIFKNTQRGFELMNEALANKVSK